jgi:hypothetical protein
MCTGIYSKHGESNFSDHVGGEVPSKNGSNVHDGPGTKPAKEYGQYHAGYNVTPSRPKDGSNVTSGRDSKSGSRDSGSVSYFPSSGDHTLANR